MPTAELEYTRPPMYPKQAAAIFNKSRYSLIEASTKSGKTVACIVWIGEYAMTGKDGQNYWWIAPTYPVSAIAFTRAKRFIPRELYVANESELSITLINGTKIWFKSGDKPDTLYGEDVYAAVIDEASRVKEESWYAIRSTLTATRGPIRIIGNVKGRKNWFFKMARRAEAGEPNMEYHKMTAQDAVEGGVLDADEIEDARRNLPKMVFKELYDAEAADDGGNPFGISHIQNQICPVSKKKPVAWGWDLAKSHDYTVGI
ncbi:MAG: phage terminase large subunit, partial [Desulfatiglandales bacterium]|nr:phage terminase large subunit [Desulfatiglandales bacterium]